MTEQELLIACYRSGQISERQWQEHMQEDPKLRKDAFVQMLTSSLKQEAEIEQATH